MKFPEGFFLSGGQAAREIADAHSTVGPSGLLHRRRNHSSSYSYALAGAFVTDVFDFPSRECSPGTWTVVLGADPCNSFTICSRMPSSSGRPTAMSSLVPRCIQSLGGLAV